MSRYDDLETNVKAIITARCGDTIDATAIFVRREMQHRGRNLGRAPLVEIECTSCQRDALCDDADMATAQLAIRVSAKQLTQELNEAVDAIMQALKDVPNLNQPVSVDALNDWTYNVNRYARGETQTIEITMTVRLVVPESEV